MTKEELKNHMLQVHIIMRKFCMIVQIGPNEEICVAG